MEKSLWNGIGLKSTIGYPVISTKKVIQVNYENGAISYDDEMDA
jgi:hypothetical protein